MDNNLVTTKEITLDTLTVNSVNVRIATFAEINGISQQIGAYLRSSYFNSPIGRERVINDIPEPFCSAIFALWGDTPTVLDPPNERKRNPIMEGEE